MTTPDTDAVVDVMYDAARNNLSKFYPRTGCDCTLCVESAIYAVLSAGLMALCAKRTGDEPTLAEIARLTLNRLKGLNP